MNFTREPLIETVITPKEGYKLVVRNSKVAGQEEYFVDAVEVISFGNASFFRSMEKPKFFLVPVSDYEILEARESRMILKTPGTERGIKIAGGREAPLKVKEETVASEEETPVSTEQRPEKRRERRRSRKRRGKGDFEEEGEETQEALPQEERKPEEKRTEERRTERPSLIPPPSTLISETISRYKSLAAGEEVPQEVKEQPSVIIPPPPPLVQHKEDEDESSNNDEEIPF